MIIKVSPEFIINRIEPKNNEFKAFIVVVPAG